MTFHRTGGLGRLAGRRRSSPAARSRCVDTDGTALEVTPADQSLQAVVKAINEHPDAGDKAAAVQMAPGKYTLQLTA